VIIAFYLPQTRQTIQLNAAVARTPADRQRGFAFRRTILPNEAIFFAFPFDVATPFTMANTLVPLDMVFLDANGRIVGIVNSAVPRNPQPYASSRPFRYVLEMPGGWLAAHGIGYRAGVGWQHNAFQAPV
jgi:uncharacterized membrane protein (UPF0127 family)